MVGKKKHERHLPPPRRGTESAVGEPATTCFLKFSFQSRQRFQERKVCRSTVARAVPFRPRTYCKYDFLALALFWQLRDRDTNFLPGSMVLPGGRKAASSCTALSRSVRWAVICLQTKIKWYHRFARVSKICSCTDGLGQYTLLTILCRRAVARSG